MLVRPEELLDLPVFDAAGQAVGQVVDVGLVDLQRPKFVLVRLPTGGTLRRVDLGGVVVSARGLRLPPG
jgi:hypothetical protein